VDVGSFFYDFFDCSRFVFLGQEFWDGIFAKAISLRAHVERANYLLADLTFCGTGFLLKQFPFELMSKEQKYLPSEGIYLYTCPQHRKRKAFFRTGFRDWIFAKAISLRAHVERANYLLADLTFYGAGFLPKAKFPSGSCRKSKSTFLQKVFIYTHALRPKAKSFWLVYAYK
jgi:hypothetical protein